MSNWVSENLSQGIHVYSGGEGSTVVLVPGWPETAEAYSELFPLLAQDHSILCVDPPGLGDSAPFEIGYDTGAISRTVEHGLRSRIKDSFHLVGHDVGAWIAYDWLVNNKAEHPERITRANRGSLGGMLFEARGDERWVCLLSFRIGERLPEHSIQ